jgi:proline dehydrogenase
MLRSVLLYLSRQKGLRHWMEDSSLAVRLTSRFVAGRNLDDALRVSAKLNAEDILVSLDHLGENVSSLAEAEGSLISYLKALTGIADKNLRATISVKLTQLGLDYSIEACHRNVSMLVERANGLGTIVEIDMESSAYVDRTLDIVKRLHAAGGKVRAVIQSYMRRSEADIQELNRLGIPVRLCKGAYKESAAVAFQDKAQVDANYSQLMELLLAEGSYPAIASHDERLVRRALTIIRSRDLAPARFEFQMLYGIRRDLQRELVDLGCRLRLYVPYGDAWYPYFMRRMAERPANLWFVARNLLRA